MSEPRPANVPEIDWLKGIAILFVVAIHAKLGEGTTAFEYVVNRAVPVFLVAFGVTSELGYPREKPGRRRAWAFIRPRLERLVPALWAMSAGWWLAVLHYDRAGALHVGWAQALVTFAGYAPWIGTAWFITLILELVLLYPVLRKAVDRVGAALVLVVGAIASTACVWFVWDIVAAGKWLLGENVPPPGWFYVWIFVPRVLWHVVAGMVVARRFGGRPPARVGVASALLWLGCAVAARTLRAADPYLGVIWEQVIVYLADAPLAVALLGACRLLAPVRPLTLLLGWCGRHSWGLYLGHLLAHEVLHMVGVSPEIGPPAVRAVYAAILLVSGVALTNAALGARRVARQMTRAATRAEKSV